MYVLQGKDAVAFLERLVVGDVQALKDGTGTLSLILNESGGIIDDTVITKVSPDEIYMVLNAGCRDKDLAHFRKHLGAEGAGDVHMTVHDDRSLLALQGPKAMETLQPLVQHDLSKVYFSNFLQGMSIAGVDGCFLTRTGCAGLAAANATETGLRRSHMCTERSAPLQQRARRWRLGLQVHGRGRLRALHSQHGRAASDAGAHEQRKRAHGGPGRAGLVAPGGGPVPLRCAPSLPSLDAERFSSNRHADVPRCVDQQPFTLKPQNSQRGSCSHATCRTRYNRVLRARRQRS